MQYRATTGGEDGFKLREMANEIVNLDVNWKYDREQLADRFEELSLVVDGELYALDVTEISANRFTAKIVSKEVNTNLTPTENP